MRTPLVIALLAAASLTASLSAADPTPAELQAQVPELIKQLGDEKYAVRRAAQQDLAAIGLASFDPLLAAREHLDLEIASSAERLLSQMTVRWTQPTNPPAVRDLLETYGQQDEGERLEVVSALAALPNAEGLEPLCRIARFDLSDRVAARAAAVIMQVVSTRPTSENVQGFEVPTESIEWITQALAELDQYYGDSRRASTQWLEWFTKQSDEPEQAAERWGRELSRLREKQRDNPLAFEGPVVDALDWNLLRVLLKAGRTEDVPNVIARLAESDPSSAASVMQRSFEWLTNADAEDAINGVLTLVEQPEPPEYFQTQQVLYLAAGLRLEQGREEDAETLADRAFEIGPEPPDALARRRPLLEGRVVTGLRLRSDARLAWAKRELQAAIEEAGPLTAEGAYATGALADMLHDAAENAAAAKVLGEFLSEIRSTPENTSRYLQLSESRSDFFRPLSEVLAGEAYFRALAHRDAGEREQEREALIEALDHDATNADIPIAMYRASEPGEEYRESTMQHVLAMADEFEQQIDQDPTDSTPYNQWAWLIANTEGDYDKAVRYSLRSLTLSEDNAGYLDTLGRCYYSAGDLEKAIEAQSRAVELEPEYLVMRRQLNFFKEELAKQQSEGQSKPQSGAL